MRETLKKLRNNEISVEEAEKILKSSNKSNNIMEIAGLANFDSSREDRTGFPEAVLAEGKDDDDLIAIISTFCSKGINNINSRCCMDNDNIKSNNTYKRYNTYNTYNNNNKNNSHNNLNNHNNHKNHNNTNTGNANNNSNNFNSSSITINSKINSSSLIITRISNDRYDNLKNNINSTIFDNYTTEYNKKARILIVRSNASKKINDTGKSDSETIGIISAGTSDIPYAEEARFVCEESGFNVIKSYDVGVAGIHRLFPKLANMINKNVRILLVFAGMEGALPSVVAGLVDIPVIGVPTSVGYGVGEKGKTALYAMLQSCAPGIAVVNIDNGFGAAAFAIKMIKNLEDK